MAQNSTNVTAFPGYEGIDQEDNVTRPAVGTNTTKGLLKNSEKRGFLVRSWADSLNPCVYALGREAPLQRLFSSFPDGRPGLGLLLLRLAVGAVAIVLGISCITSAAHRVLSVWLVGTVLAATGIALIIGFVTVIASVLLGLCVVGITLSWIPSPPLGSLGAPMIGILVGIVAIGIALIGPGAFSVDGYLFGRREIVIPPRPPDS